ncbi:FliA/WhiG family RNA polymerase sigma factor [Actinomycetospora chibensis]|uniref:RNA polymerase sigma factor n=1 Tax=Actinomycetospora chibensis TaxID=663606 RepID=A0ABV9RMT3_9PSEU|nr:FliA/WhiG family RNA polymerase sigma factor [Actinomycetospora chibensis]MDD7924334.1 FliA/WhiG family RNA polymerase sigma factor [Actinomycetospora chibensis]
MTPPTPAPEPRRDGASVATTAAPPTGPLPALPGIDSDAAVRAAGAAARTPRRAPRREPAGPVTDGATALAPVPAPADGSRDAAHAAVHALPATLGRVAAGAPDEEALVEAGIAELWAAFEADPRKSTKDRLVLHYAPLVKYVAGRVGTGLPSHVDVADLIQCGIFGLVDAIERFEPDRGRKFEVYAMQRIRGAILDELRSQDWVPRSVRSRAREIERAIERLEGREQRSCSDSELAQELDTSTEDLRSTFGQIAMTSVAALDELVAAGRAGGGGGDGGSAPSLADSLPDTDAEDPLAAMEDRETRRLLAEAVGQLAERDRTVVGLYYFENLTLAEIGRVLGVTESRVCQLHTRAVMRLRGRLAELQHA